MTGFEVGVSKLGGVEIFWSAGPGSDRSSRIGRPDGLNRVLGDLKAEFNREECKKHLEKVALWIRENQRARIIFEVGQETVVIIDDPLTGGIISRHHLTDEFQPKPSN